MEAPQKALGALYGFAADQFGAEARERHLRRRQQHVADGCNAAGMAMDDEEFSGQVNGLPGIPTRVAAACGGWVRCGEHRNGLLRME